MKKVVSVLLSVALFCSLFSIGSFTVSAAGVGGLTYIISNGEVTITGCDKSVSGELTIPDTIEDYPVIRIKHYAFVGHTNLTSIVIPKSMKEIGPRAFSDCDNLKEVHISDLSAWYEIDFGNSDANPLVSADGVLYLNGTPFEMKGDIAIPDGTTRIGSYAFYGCTGLTSITIPDSVTSIGDYPFEDCRSLKSVTIPDSVTSIGGCAFYGCTGLTSITIPDSVTSIGGHAFIDCTGLTSITIPDSVTSIGDYAFEDCRSLTSVTIGDGVTSMGVNPFGNCSKLATITVSGNNTAYASQDGALFNKEKTELVCYPAGKTGAYTIPNSVTTIGDAAFEGCNGLASVTILDGVISIANFTFFDCRGLTSITIPDSVTSIGGCAFDFCYNLSVVWYTGSESDRKNLSIADGNTALTNATWRYNACDPNQHQYDNSCDTVCNRCEWERLPDVKTLTIEDKTVWDDAWEQKTEYDPQTGTYKTYRHYYLSSDSLRFAVTMQDGTIIEDDGYGNLTIGDKTYCLENITHNQLNEPWQSGGTYAVSASILGLTDTFNVTVAENPKAVVALDIEDTVAMWGSESFSRDLLGTGMLSSGYPVFAPKFTVTLRDGTTLTTNDGHIHTDDYGCISLKYEGDTSAWVVGGTYEMTASYKGVTDTFNVTLKDTCVESVEIADIKIIENANTSTQSVYNEQTGQWELYDRYTYRPNFTVTFKDGTQFTGDAYNGVYTPWWDSSTMHVGGFEWVGIHPAYTDTQETQHWELGGTYEVTAWFLGVTDTFTVTVIENPVKEIVIEDITCVENQNGRWWSVYNEETGLYEEMYYYNTAAILKEDPKIVLQDGSIVKPFEWVMGSFLVNVCGASYEIYPGEVVAGENVVTVRAFGTTYPVSINVTTKPAPTLDVEKVEIADLSVFKNAYGSIEILPCYTVTLKDGRVFQNDDKTPWCIMIDGERYTLKSWWIDENWQVGEVHTLVGEVGGVSDEFTVTVIENPIESITAQDVCVVDYEQELHNSIFYNEDTGRYERKVQYRFDLLPSVAVTLKDGSVVRMNREARTMNERYPVKIYNNYVSAIRISPQGELTELHKECTYFVSMYDQTDEFNLRLADHIYDTACDADCNVCGDVRTVPDHVYTNACDKDCNVCGVTRTPSAHRYDNACDKMCNVCGATRTVPSHVYTNACDADCNICGATRTVTHTYSTAYDAVCDVCGHIRESVIRPSLGSTKHTVTDTTVGKITAGLTIESLLANLDGGENCKVYNGSAVVDGKTKVGTGMTVKIMDGATTVKAYTAVVTGDTNGDGNITVTDMIAIKAHVLKKTLLTDASKTAADTNGDNGISITDFIQIKAKILGKGTITAR